MPSLLRVSRYARLLRSFLVGVICDGVLLFMHVIRAQVQKADYQFHNTRRSSTGSSSLSDTSAFSNGTQTDTVNITTRTVLHLPFKTDCDFLTGTGFGIGT